MPRILFYFYNSVHVPVLLPVFEAMQQDSTLEIAFAVHSTQEEIKAGLCLREEGKLRKLTIPMIKTPQSWGAEVTIVGDIFPEVLHGCGRIVNIGHGLLSKGVYFTNTKYIHRENLASLLCVPGDYHKKRLEKSGKIFVPVVVTGFPKLDRLFHSSYPSREELMRRGRLDQTKKVILFAPTYNWELSAIPILWTRVKVLATPERYLLIKLHEATNPEFLKIYKKLAQSQENIILVNDADITPYLQIADVMLSDVSSAFFEFASLNKPVVLFNNPNIREFPQYDSNDPEYAWRDIGIQTSTLEEVQAAIDRSLENPGEFAEKRAIYTRQLLGDLDGNAGLRVKAEIMKLLARKVPSPRTVQELLTVILPFKTQDVSLIEPTIQSIQAGGVQNLQFIFLNISRDPQVISALEQHQWKARIIFPEGLAFIAAEESLSKSAFIAWISPGVTGEDRWLFRLVNHLRRSPDLEGIVPLATHGAPVQDAPRRLGIESETLDDWASLDRYVRLANAGNHIRLAASPRTSCWLMRNNTQTSRLALQTAGKTMRIPESILPFSSLALDVVVGFPDLGLETIHKMLPPLNFQQQELAEARIAELADWIGSIFRTPEHLAPSERETTTTDSAPESGDDKIIPLTETNPHLHLALHFERRGKRKEAIKHLRLVLKSDPDLPEVQAAAKRLGLTGDCNDT